MIRVLHTIDTTGPGGAETVFINLVAGLDKEKYLSIPAIFGPGWVCDVLHRNNIEPLFIKQHGGYNLEYLKDLIRIIKHYKIDVIQSHLLGSNVYCCMAGIICKVPVISTFHGFVDANHQDRNLAIKRLIINYGSTKIVFVSDHLKNYYIENMHFSNRKSITIYNGVDTSVFYPNKDDSIRKKFGFGPENIVIGAVGNVRPAKGYDMFIKAARLLYKNHPECRFVVAGHFSGRLFSDLTKLRDDLGLEKVFYFIGFQPIPSLVYNNIDIFVSSSNSEGFSISIIEAMACGIPVIATRSGGPEEIISDENNGLLINTGSPEMLSQGISRIINNSTYREKLISNGLKYVNFNFSLSETQKTYQLMYHNCLN